MKYRFHRAATGEHYDNVNFYEDRLPGLEYFPIQV